MSTCIESITLANYFKNYNKTQVTRIFDFFLESIYKNKTFPIKNFFQSKVKLIDGKIAEISQSENSSEEYQVPIEDLTIPALNFMKLISEEISRLKINKKILPKIIFGSSPNYSGGFADLYIANFNNMQVMIKLMKANRLENDKKLAIRELRRCEELRYDSIAEYLGYFHHDDGNLAIVTKFYSAGSLSEMIKANHPFSIEQKLKICYKIAKGIEFIHLHGLCHFDIKPANILLDNFWNPKISDFGTCQKPKISYKNSLAYTLNYAPPEQINGKAVKQSDVWNFAMTVYSLFTGQSLYKDLKLQKGHLKKNDVINYLESREYQNNIVEMVKVGKELDELILKALRLDPFDRPTAKDFRLALYNECINRLIDPESNVYDKVDCSQDQAPNHS